jgi:tetratricopeptide (TPR) repeat protein
MDDFDNALMNFKKTLECFPTHYTYLKKIIHKTLSFGFIQESNQYATQLFEIEPTNPTVSKDLIEIYLDNQYPDILIELFKELINKNTNSEVLGNLNFHLGLLHLNVNKEVEGKSYILTAKQYFEKVFTKDSYVFKVIEKLCHQ